MEHILQTE